MRGIPLTLSRPSRAYDGEGGFVETIAAPMTIFGDPAINDNETVLAIAADEDVRVGDLIEIPHQAFFEKFLIDAWGRVRIPAVQISGLMEVS